MNGPPAASWSSNSVAVSAGLCCSSLSGRLDRTTAACSPRTGTLGLVSHRGGCAQSCKLLCTARCIVWRMVNMRQSHAVAAGQLLHCIRSS